MTIDDLKIFRPYEVSNLKRMGNKYDGGYIVHYPSLQDADYLVNYGVGYNVEFEKAFFKINRKPTLAFDPTLSDVAPILEKLVKMEFIPFLRHIKHYMEWIYVKKTLYNSNINFIEEGISHENSKKYKTFEYHFHKYHLNEKKIIFKMDIEGAEYDVFKDGTIYKYLKDAVQIYIEFHYLYKYLEEAAKIISILSETHSLVHIHANNHGGVFKYKGIENIPNTIEVSFLLNSYLPVKKYSASKYPVSGLDYPCNRLQDDIPLDFFIIS